jgi:hypothetical protein
MLNLFDNFKDDQHPHFIIGERGTGKTFLLQEFGRKATSEFAGEILIISGKDKIKLITKIKNILKSPPTELTLLAIDDIESLSPEDIVQYVYRLKMVPKLKLVITSRKYPKYMDPSFKTIWLEAPSASEIIKKRMEFLYNKKKREDLFNTVNNLINLYDTSGKATKDAILGFAEFIKDQNRQGEITIADVETISTSTKNKETRIKVYFLGVMFPIILFILSQISSSRSEKRIRERIKSVDTKLEKLIPDAGRKNNLQIYFVNRYARLRNSPSTINSSVIEVLAPNTILTLVSRKDKWLKVRYYDLINDKVKIGWVYQTYLTQLDMD